MSDIEYKIDMLLRAIEKGDAGQLIEAPIRVKDAAEFVKMNKQSIYDLVHKREIPFHKPAKALLFYRSELNDWIKSKSA